MPGTTDRSPALAPWARWRHGTVGWAVGQTWTEILRKDPSLSNVAVCADLVFGGTRRVLIASRAITSTSSRDGTVYNYLPVLAEVPDLVQGFTIGQSTSQARQISLSLSDAHVDCASLVAAGRPLAGWGEISLQVDGMDWDQRLVILQGTMEDGVTCGTPKTGMVGCSLTDPKDAADLLIPPWIVDSTRWPDADSSASGQRYPLIVGGYNEVPAPCVDNGTSSGTVQHLAAYGHGWTINVDTGVTVGGETKDGNGTDAEWTWEAMETVDSKGTPVTLIQWTGSHTFDFSEDVRVTVTTTVDREDLLTAIQILIRDYSMLGQTGFSSYLFAVATSRLSSFWVRILTNASGSSDGQKALEFIESSLLQVLPMVSMIWSWGGYGPVVTDRRDRRFRMALTRNAWPLRDRRGEVRETPASDVKNSFTLSYQYRTSAGTYLATASRTPENSDICRLSETIMGPRPADPIEAPFVEDQSIAEGILDWMVAHQTLVSYDVEYDAEPATFFLLLPGDNVQLTDDQWGWSLDTATVTGITFSPSTGSAVVALRVWSPFYKIGGASAVAGA